jgi:hypothetical protein
MSNAGFHAGSDIEDDGPSKITREELHRLRRIAREAEKRKGKEREKDDDYKDDNDKDRERGDHKDSNDRRKYWKTTEVGYFWPDMPLSYGPGRIVDYDGSRYFRDVNSFVTQLKDSMATFRIA